MIKRLSAMGLFLVRAPKKTYIIAAVLLAIGLRLGFAYADAGLFSVSGTITSGGANAGNVLVDVNRPTQSGTNGQYTIGNLANGTYPMTISGNNIPCDNPSNACSEEMDIVMAVQNSNASPPTSPITVNGANVTQNLALPQTVPVTVTVDNADGSNAQGASVTASSQSGQAVDANDSSITYVAQQNSVAVSVFANNLTPNSGTVTLNVIPGYTYSFCANSSGAHPLQACSTVSTVSSATSTTINLPAPPSTFSVSGTITSGGANAGNVLVDVNRPTQSGTNGQYTIGNLANGTYPMTISGNNIPCDNPSNACSEEMDIVMAVQNSNASPPTSPITVNGANVTQNLALPQTVPVTVTVDNADGSNAQGASVTASSQSGQAVDANDSSITYVAQQNSVAVSVFANNLTPNSGTVTLNVIPGYTYSFCANSSGAHPLQACSTVSTVSSATSTTINLPAPPSTFSVSGTITSGGANAGNVLVDVNRPTQSGTNGQYTIGNLANGTYPMTISGNNIPCDNPSNACSEEMDIVMAVQNSNASPPTSPITVNGANVTQNLALPQTVPVTVTVDNADGSNAQGASVTASSQSGQAVDANDSSITYVAQQNSVAVSVFANNLTPNSGTVTLNVIPGYTYSFCANSSGAHPLQACTTINVSSGSTTTVVVPGPTPTNLTAQSPTTTPILNWTGQNLTDNAVYDVYRNGSVIGTSTTPTYTDTSAPTGNNSYYVVIDASGYPGLPTNTITVDVVSLATPTNLTIPSPTQNPVLSWDAVSGATSYNIYRDNTKIDSSTTNSYTDNNATEGTHSYYVTAVNSGGESGHSNTVSNVLVDRTQPTITYAVTPVTDSNGYNTGQVTVTFTCTDNTDGSGITSCTSPVTLDNEGIGQTVSGTATDNAGNTTTVQANASLLVRAVNAGGNASGNYAADTNFTGGSPYSEGNSTVDTSNVTVMPANQDVYQSSRYGNMSYTFSGLTPGNAYTLRLHFNEVFWGANGNSGGIGSRVFNVAVNGTSALSNFDIFKEAGGANVALVKEVQTTADSNGNVTVQFTNVTDNALVNGLELYNGNLPSEPPAPTITSAAINAGGDAADSFVADSNFSGGQAYSANDTVDTSNVTNPAPQAIYQSDRYGNFTYTVRHLTPNTNFLVRLHFNENYWGADGNSGGVGSRLFNVAINGTQVLNNFDVYATAGGANKAVVEEFTEPSDSNGSMSIQFTSVTDNAMVSGIEVEPAN